jgi:hypothetical protein
MAKSSKPKPIRILYAHLGQYKADGLAWPDERTIAIDRRLKGPRELEVIIHEILHCQNPAWPEEEVDRKAHELAGILWGLNWRKVEQ